jgi:AraC-like DNA-binding protein
VSAADFGCVWHYHPECEITWVVKGGTERTVGDTVSPLVAGDLVFLGPNLPHDFQNDPPPGQPLIPVQAMVVQFSPDIPGLDYQKHPSLLPIERLFRRANRGLEIKGQTKAIATSFIEQMVEARGLRRVILLLQLLDLFAGSTEVEEICSYPFVREDPNLALDRIGKACAHIKSNLEGSIYVEELATMVGLGKSAFSRLFKKSTGRSVPQYVNGLRIAHACRMLAETDLTVSQIAQECGFISPAHFQRQFRELQHCTPLSYRSRVCQVL